MSAWGDCQRAEDGGHEWIIPKETAIRMGMHLLPRFRELYRDHSDEETKGKK